MIDINLRLTYHEKQIEIIDDPAKYKVIAKGRRFGITKCMANLMIEKMLDEEIKVLWVDTIYSNIQRYVERYFIPELKKLPRRLWKYNITKSELRIGNSHADLKSADKPENMEGFGYHLVLLNEAGIILKNEMLWNESIRPMTLDYKAEVIIAGTPKGKRTKKGKEHLFYKLFKKAKADGERWKAFQYSSYDNPLLDKEAIEEMESEISPLLRDEEIYGQFVDTQKDSIVKREWWKFYEENELRSKKNYGVYQSWDTAFKDNEENDFSVCTTWMVTENEYCLIDMMIDRLIYPRLKETAKSQYSRFRPLKVLIEDKASGQSLIQDLLAETRIPIEKIKKSEDTLSMVHTVSPIIESGRVLLPADRIELTDKVINQFEEYPAVEHDDIVVSVAQFLNWAKANKFYLINKDKIKSKKVVRRKFY